MNYSVNTSEIKGNDTNLRGFANVVLGDSFKISNIGILESKIGNLFVSMPRFKSSERDETGAIVYKDVCNPITKEFHDELYNNILDVFVQSEKQVEFNKVEQKNEKVPKFSVSVTPYEKEGSNIRGLARIYFDNSFVVNNISILQGKEERLFVAMPSYRIHQLDSNNKPIYQDICYPVTKEFREKLYGELIEAYHQAKGIEQKEVQKHVKIDQSRKEAPFR